MITIAQNITVPPGIWRLLGEKELFNQVEAMVHEEAERQRLTVVDTADRKVYVMEGEEDEGTFVWGHTLGSRRATELLANGEAGGVYLVMWASAQEQE